MTRRTRATIFTLVGASIAAAALAQYSPPRRFPPAKDPGDPYDFDNAYVLSVPEGTYTALVFTAGHGKASDQIVFNIRAGDQDFPFYVEPGTTQIIPFENGWEVPDGTLVFGTEDQRFSVWGITADGPVRFPMATTPTGRFTR
jgi:hypothetical protein